MRLADLGDLRPTLNTAEAAEWFDVSKDHLWKLAREGAAPVEPIRLGGTLRWPTARILEVLGLDLKTPTHDQEGVDQWSATPVTTSPNAAPTEPESGTGAPTT